MAMQMTFQEVCTVEDMGFVCDSDSMAKLNKQESYNDLVIKLATKCEMDLVFLAGVKGQVGHFTIDVVPEDPVNGIAITVTKSKGVQGKPLEVGEGCEAVAAAWQQCVARGYHGLHAFTHLTPANMPHNACRDMYSFAQFINSLLHSLEAHFMFLKANEKFRLNAMNLWETMEDLMMQSCYLVLVWQYTEEPNTVSGVTRSPLVSLNTKSRDIPDSKLSPVVKATNKKKELPSPTLNTEVELPVMSKNDAEMLKEPEIEKKTSRRKSVAALARLVKEPEDDVPEMTVKEPVKRVTPAPTNVKAERGGKRGRRSLAARVEEPADEEDTEVTFKNPLIPQASYHPDMSPEKPSAKEPPAKPEAKAEAMEVDRPTEAVKMNISIEDVTLAFEKPAPKTGRKSTAGRKSLAPEWPEEEKEDVLHFFDNLNPAQTEQSRIALTCKYTSMKFSKELSSKQLYQWVQKKGREVTKTVTNHELAEELHQDTTVTFFHSLGTELSEASRINFTCKFMHTQYGVTVTSKTLYDWLSNKNKKASRRR